jgi:hypothetical protein
MTSVDRRVKIILSLKNQEAVKNQQEGALRFYIQDELTKARIITRLKENLSGYNPALAASKHPGDGIYDHRSSGYLEKSITPGVDKITAWGKNITSRLKVDGYLGLGVGIENVSARIDMASYGDKLDKGHREKATLTNMQLWVYSKARRRPNTAFYIFNGKKPYFYSGDRVNLNVAEIVAKFILKRYNSVGYEGSGWLDVLQEERGLTDSVYRAYLRYLKDYPEYVYATSIVKINKMIERL